MKIFQHKMIEKLKIIICEQFFLIMFPNCIYIKFYVSMFEIFREILADRSRILNLLASETDFTFWPLFMVRSYF